MEAHNKVSRNKMNESGSINAHMFTRENIRLHILKSGTKVSRVVPCTNRGS